MGLQAALTGVFCIAFALVVDAATDALSLGWIVVLSFLSGAGGSLFAQAVLSNGRSGRQRQAPRGGEGAQ